MSNRQEYRQLVKLLGQGKLRPVIDRHFPLAEAGKAMEYLQNSSQFGKVLLLP